MRKSLFLFILLSSLILAACQPAAATPAGAPPAGATSAVNSGSAPDSGDKGYPAQSATSASAENAVAPANNAAATPAGYPGPESASANGSAFPVTADDAAMTKANFMIDSATLQPVANQPGQADVMAQGSLPTSCNKPRVVVPAPDADKKILIQAYSLVEKDKICAQAIEPFNGKLAMLSGLPAGKYTVMVNEVSAGELTVP